MPRDIAASKHICVCPLIEAHTLCQSHTECSWFRTLHKCLFTPQYLLAKWNIWLGMHFFFVHLLCQYLTPLPSLEDPPRMAHIRINRVWSYISVWLKLVARRTFSKTRLWNYDKADLMATSRSFFSALPNIDGRPPRYSPECARSSHKTTLFRHAANKPPFWWAEASALNFWKCSFICMQ